MKRQLLLKLDKETHKAFKVKCLSNDASMTEVLTSMVYHYTNNDEIGITVKIIERESKPKQDMRLVTYLDGATGNLPLKRDKGTKGHFLYWHDELKFTSIEGMFYQLAANDYTAWRINPNLVINHFKKKLDNK